MSAADGKVLYRFNTGGAIGGGLTTYATGRQAIRGGPVREHLAHDVEDQRVGDVVRLRRRREVG
jgi:hypothetical protein